MTIICLFKEDICKSSFVTVPNLHLDEYINSQIFRKAKKFRSFEQHWKAHFR